jgi:phage tail sheath gpL-like
MSLTSIGSQKTPGRPIEQTFAAETGTPSDDQELLLIGHMAATGAAGSGTSTVYQVASMSNVADSAAAKTEAETKFGVGSELAKMVVAAVKANELSGGSNFPSIKCMPLASTDTGFGASDVALTNARNTKAEFIVSPYNGNDSVTRGKLKDHAILVSGAQRVENNQFGSFGVVANMSVADPGTLPSPDTLNLICIWHRDSAPTLTVGELAAACAAKMAALVVPFNPLDDAVVGGIDEQVTTGDKITVGAGLESETALDKGWTPLRTMPNGDVAIVRSVTSRITVDGTVAATAYYDVQDFMVLFFWRKTLKTRMSQPDMKQAKASAEKAGDVLSEMIRLANLFQEQGMFQAVAQLAKKFKVERSSSDRHRLDYKTPVNVIPGLHVIAGNIEASTEFDVLSL